MTIAVAIDGTSYDATEALTAEQKRISQFLSFASPRDVNDLSQVYKFLWPSATNSANFTPPGDTGGVINPGTDNYFNTFIRTSFDKTGRPFYGVYATDDAGKTHYLSGNNLTSAFAFQNVVVVAPSDTRSIGGGKTVASLIGTTSQLPDGTSVTIQAGDLVQNPANIATGGQYGQVSRTVVGRVKFEAESGLALESINSRLADINNVIETLAKVLSTQSDMFTAASGIVR